MKLGQWGRGIKLRQGKGAFRVLICAGVCLRASGSNYVSLVSELSAEFMYWMWWRDTKETSHTDELRGVFRGVESHF